MIFVEYLVNTKTKAIFFIVLSIILSSVMPSSMQTAGSKEISNIDFKNQVQEIYTSSPWYDQTVESVDIGLKVKFNQINYLENLFQTSHSNTGIRMEVSDKSELFLVLGSKENPGYIAWKVISNIVPGKWYDIRINVNNDLVQTFLNQKLVFENVYRYLDYSVTDVVVGSGFSRQRGFTGLIKGFRIEYNFKQIFDANYFSIFKFATLLLLFATLFFNEITSTLKAKTPRYIYKDQKCDDNKLINLFLLVPFSLMVVYMAYYLYIGIFYIPPDTISGLFMGFRHMGGMNDIPSETFSQWLTLLWVSVVFFLVIYLSYWIGVIKDVSYNTLIPVMYIATIAATFLFLFLTTNGLQHFTMQVDSINNGIYYSYNVLFDGDMGAGDALERIKYIFSSLSSNNSGYTLPGTTHPPGEFVVSLAIGILANLISDNVAFGWGVVVTAINALLVPVIMLISREIFSDKIGRLTGIMLVATPSVCMHFSAMFDIIFSLSIMLGVLFLIYGLKYSRSEGNRYFIQYFLGVASGLFFCLSVQGTYGHAIPVLSFIVSFILIAKKDAKMIFLFFLGMLTPVVLYFILEFYLSSGKSFWPVRALNIVNLVGNGLIESRPFPLAYFANFIVVSIIGGVLMLPTIVYVFHSSLGFIKRMYMGSATFSSQEQAARFFLMLAVFFMTLFLLVQTTVRLEVERTWHWYLSAVWPLTGIFFIALSVFIKRVFALKNVSNNKYYGALMLIYFQAISTLVLSISIMDYY